MRTYQCEDFAKFTFGNFWKYCANQTKAMYIFWRFVLIQLMYNEGDFLLLTCSWRMSLNVFVRMKCRMKSKFQRKIKTNHPKSFLFYSNISILKNLFYCNSKVNIYNKENWFVLKLFRYFDSQKNWPISFQDLFLPLASTLLLLNILTSTFLRTQLNNLFFTLIKLKNIVFV